MPAVSKSQQRAAGIALSVKRGDTPESELQGAAKEMYDSMTEKELEDFAETEHKGLPNKKESVVLSKLFHKVREVVREELNETMTINEAEEVQMSDLDSNQQKTIQSLSKVLDVGKRPEAIFKSIHGVVVQFENSKAMGSYRFSIKELKTLSKLPIRWIESDKRSVSIGL